MFSGIVLAAFGVAGLVQQTDTIVQAEGAARLELEVFQGQVVVQTWDRDAVRIQADHGGSLGVDVHRSGGTIVVEPDVERGYGFAHTMDFEITVPVGLDLSLEGVALEVDIRGSEGEIEVTTAHGAITVQGGRGSIVLESVNGPILLEGARGDMEVVGVAGGVTILDCSGDIYAESVGGNLSFENVTSSDVEAGTVGGTLRYDGTIEDGGSYSFGSHAGSIWLTLPSTMNAEVETLTLAGDIEIDFPGAPSEPESEKGLPGLRKKEMHFEVGNGSARIEVETFAGTIRIQRTGGM
jgi:DUF4097 and DUF4098 domain-containing protein YvlB